MTGSSDCFVAGGTKYVVIGVGVHFMAGGTECSVTVVAACFGAEGTECFEAGYTGSSVCISLVAPSTYHCSNLPNALPHFCKWSNVVPMNDLSLPA